MSLQGLVQPDDIMRLTAPCPVLLPQEHVLELHDYMCGLHMLNFANSHRPHLKRQAAASSAGTSLEANLKHLTATLASRIAVPADWKPPAGHVEHRLVRLAWSQQRDQLVRGLMWCPVIAPRKPPQAPRSSQEATQPAASEPGPSTPPPAKRSKRTKAEQAAEPTQPIKGKGKAQGKAAKAKQAPQPGRCLDRDCNAALNVQRIGAGRGRPLELCWWPDQATLPAKGNECSEVGYKWLRDRPPKAQHQQPLVAQYHVPGGQVHHVRLACLGEVSQRRWGTHKQLMIFFGNANIGTQGGWGAKTVLQACRKEQQQAD
ncbi:hypothetical protein QJQ45_011341 [Haematococcus lacustris]|nr:hypothetical protein QJQ45_011341 [Haematococcus lacustris]